MSKEEFRQWERKLDEGMAPWIAGCKWLGLLTLIFLAALVEAFS